MKHFIELYPYKIEKNTPYFKVNYLKIKEQELYMRINSKFQNEKYIGPIIKYNFNIKISQ